MGSQLTWPLKARYEFVQESRRLETMLYFHPITSGGVDPYWNPRWQHFQHPLLSLQTSRSERPEKKATISFLLCGARTESRSVSFGMEAEVAGTRLRGTGVRFVIWMDRTLERHYTYRRCECVRVKKTKKKTKLVSLRNWVLQVVFVLQNKIRASWALRLKWFPNIGFKLPSFGVRTIRTTLSEIFFELLGDSFSRSS